MSNKKSDISTDFKQRDGVATGDSQVELYQPVSKPKGYYAELYKNAEDQLQKVAILQAHDFAYADGLSHTFNSVEHRENFKLQSFIEHLKSIGYEISKEDNHKIEEMQSAYTIPLSLDTSLDYTEKTYRRVRKKVNFISTTSLKELFLMTDDVIDDGVLIPVSIRNKISSPPEKDKVIVITNKVYSMLVNIQDLLNKNDNRSFAIERFYEAIVADFEAFHSTAKEDEIYDIVRLASLIISEKARSVEYLDKAYKELHAYIDSTPKGSLSGRKSGFDLEKEPDEIRMLFAYNNDVALNFKDELFYSEMLNAI